MEEILKKMSERYFILIIVLFIIIPPIGIIIELNTKEEEVKPYFVQYDDKRLVEILNFDDNVTAGFIDNTLYKEYIQGKRELQMIIYDPYVEEKIVKIQTTEDMKKIDTLLYSEFYIKYPPKID